MVAAHGKIFVVGGEANVSSGAARDDPSLIHVLDTSRYSFASKITVLINSQNQIPSRQSGATSSQSAAIGRSHPGGLTASALTTIGDATVRTEAAPDIELNRQLGTSGVANSLF